MTTERAKCHHCGRTIPKNRGDTDWCSKKCYYLQDKSDIESMRMEREIQDKGVIPSALSSFPDSQ